VSLRINFYLEDTALFGGVKVVLHHAELLRRRGHRVAVVSKGASPSWYPIGAGFLQLPDFTPERVPPADLHVATFWTTVAAATAQPSGTAVHFCQGFEAALVHNRDEHPSIIETYARPLPVWAVSEPLVELNRGRFRRATRLVPPALEPFWQPQQRDDPAERARVVVAHPFQFYMKGVDVALDAVRRLRQRGIEIELVRLSQWPLSDDERAVLEPDEFHHHIPPAEVAGLLAGCDLLLAPSWESEGFGLTVLEAMACGVPVVASKIPSHESFAADAALLVSGREPEAFAEAASAVLADPVRWNRMRGAGLDVAAAFAENSVAAIVDDAARWAASGDWAKPL
jgi:glycosyltransferase involved in cell wall biosynthesis